MHGLSILKNAEVVLGIAAAAAGTGTSNGTAQLMEGYESATFIGSVGTMTSTGTYQLKVQGSNDNSTWADCTGATKTLADTEGGKTVIVEVVRSIYKYLRPVVVRATANSVQNGVIGIFSHARKSPITQGATVSASTSVVGV